MDRRKRKDIPADIQSFTSPQSFVAPVMMYLISQDYVLRRLILNMLNHLRKNKELPVKIVIWALLLDNLLVEIEVQ